MPRNVAFKNLIFKFSWGGHAPPPHPRRRAYYACTQSSLIALVPPALEHICYSNNMKLETQLHLRCTGSNDFSRCIALLACLLNAVSSLTFWML